MEWEEARSKIKGNVRRGILPPINDRSKLSEYLVAGFTKEFSHEATALG